MKDRNKFMFALADGWQAAYWVAVGDVGCSEARKTYAATLVDALAVEAGWIAIDASIGADPGESGESPDGSTSATEQLQGMALLSQMTSELASGATLLTDLTLDYAAAAITRQLVECEYLLVLFESDIQNAAAWRMASPSEVRSNFSPSQLRNLGGFSNIEYWTHCDVGGHPNPKGAQLIERERLRMSQGNSEFPAVLANELRLDLLYHLDRIWHAQRRLLELHHSRFSTTHSALLAAVERAREQWADADPMADPTFAQSVLTRSSDQGKQHQKRKEARSEEK